MSWMDRNFRPIAVERQKLYEQVWTVPGTILAAQYGVSDVGLAKICRRHGIPRPPRGYWARRQAGQSVKPKPLPKIKGDGNHMVQIHGWNMPDEVIEKLVDASANQTNPDAKSDLTTATTGPDMA